MVLPKLPPQIVDQMLEMIAADLPTAFIAHHLKIEPINISRIRYARDPQHGIKAAEILRRARFAKVKRMKAHIAAYPNRSLFD